MEQLILGLVLFFGVHSVSIVALPLRDRLAARSELGWKAFYAVVSAIGLVFVVRGYEELRLAPTVLYASPFWLRYAAAVILLPFFALVLAPYFPGRIATAVKHPQLVAVKLWAVAHLLVNGTLADVLLFGSFLIWAVADRISLKRRPARPVAGMRASAVNDIVVVVMGLAMYVAMVFWLHEIAFGVRPFA